MSLFGALLGHARNYEIGEATKDFAGILAAGEQIILAFKLVRDVVILTDRRIIFVDKQGLTGRKTELMSVPYRAISRFSVETQGNFDLEAELKIWIGGAAEPLQRTFSKGVDVLALQAALADRLSR
ncbi:PH domain-containing protein [Sabulicella rubraurantiaca]|uniref:PH domain-containing protein n=1 Tax=Sabulicella rubraurantiaca TaxID=2811429 RepID=UPI001A97C53D|nr:PH domain-containing protein [Sabulicella rubraurantiaca]